MKYDICSLCIMIAIISFLGFILENIWLCITKGFIDNRNMSAPFLLGYGLLVVCIYVFIGTPSNITILGRSLYKKSKLLKYILYFLLAMFIVSLCEILLGFFVEKFFGFEYWNYAQIPFHITKYTSIPTSMGFASVIFFFMNIIFEPVMNIILQINSPLKVLFAVSLSVIMIADFVVSFHKMFKTKKLNTKWILHLNKDRNYKYYKKSTEYDMHPES